MRMTSPHRSIVEDTSLRHQFRRSSTVSFLNGLINLGPVATSRSNISRRMWIRGVHRSSLKTSKQGNIVAESQYGRVEPMASMSMARGTTSSEHSISGLEGNTTRETHGDIGCLNCCQHLDGFSFHISRFLIMVLSVMSIFLMTATNVRAIHPEVYRTGQSQPSVVSSAPRVIPAQNPRAIHLENYK